MPTRKELCERMIERGNIDELLRTAEMPKCACMGARDGEPLCVCKMDSKQVRAAVSLAWLRRGRLVRIKQ